MVHHGASLAVESGDEALPEAVASGRFEVLGPRGEALCRYAMKLTVWPWAMDERDLDPLRTVGLQDGDIVDANQVVAYYNYVNRVADGLGVELEDRWPSGSDGAAGTACGRGGSPIMETRGNPGAASGVRRGMKVARPLLIVLGVVALGTAALAVLRSGDHPVVAGGDRPLTTDPADSRRNHVPLAPDGDALVDPELIISVGLPPDGIPPIDEPKFLDPGDVGFLASQEPVISVVVDGEARAYPVRIMMWHEIVNDEVGGVPVTVTYCPLCNTGIAFRRPVVDGELLDFGTSGRLYNSNLVMYDRQTESYWSQATGQAILGELVGMELELVPAQVVSWGDWRTTYPGGRVLSQDTGYDRAYGQNPYQGYDSPHNDQPSLFVGTPDPRLKATARVLGVSAAGSAIAFPYEELEAIARDGTAVADAEVGEQPVVVFWKEGTASALDQPEIAASRLVGSATAYGPRSGDLLLRFVPEGGGFVDMQTGSRWDVFGRAVAGPLKGTQLEALPAVDHFWFSWAAFFPETEIYGA